MKIPMYTLAQNSLFMKKLLTVLVALTLFAGASFAQSKDKQQTVKTTTTATATSKVKKDGTPDKRFKANKKLKKDGTVDKRYKENKKS